MAKMKLVVAAFAFVFLAAFAGCVLRDMNNQPLPGSEKLGIKNITLAPNASDIICQEVPGDKPCYCMFCENQTHWYNYVPILSAFFDTTLVEGECRFDHCNASDAMKAIVDNDNIQMRVFMTGNGPTFTAADKANLYCNYSNLLAMNYLRGSSGLPPQVPRANRSTCWLERNIMPVHMYYTKGQAIDPARTGQIAHAFDGLGPVVITTELDFNSSDPSAVSNVKQQIVKIKQNCDKCLAVLAVKSGDTNAVRQVLDDPAPYYNNRNMSNLTDMVGFGFRANDYPDCDIIHIIGYNLQFSRFILKNYSKPTIWLYAGASEGNNIDGSCQFSPQTVHDFYQKIFAATPGLASSGVVGASFYEFMDGTGPLPCNGIQGCNFGVVLANGSQKHPEINTWSSLCQYFADTSFRNPLIFSRNSMGSKCDYLQNWKMYRVISTEANPDISLLDTSEVVPMSRVSRLNCGEICVSDTPMQRPKIFDRYPGPTATFSGGSHCSDYPQIEEYADEAEISSLYFRALVEQESNFDPWVVSCNTKPCNIAANTTMDQICQMAGYPAGCPAHTLNQLNNKICPSSAPYFCAMGLAQCIKLPGDSGLTSLCGGGSSYDPFKPSHSICCGVNELKAGLNSAKSFLQSNRASLFTCPEGLNDGEFGWAQYYLAANMYYGGPSTGNLTSFLLQRDANGPCSGEQNYIRYLRSFTASTLGGMRDSEYGAKQLTIYLDAIPKCQSDCPGAANCSSIAAGQTGSMRAFGHSLAVGTFQGFESSITSRLASQGVSIQVDPTAACVGASISDTTDNVQLAGHHSAIVLYTGANDLSLSQAEIQAAFNALFAAADAKADKIYVFNIIEFGNSAQWSKIASINAYLQSYANAHSGKFVLVDINGEMRDHGGSACPYHKSDTHGCYDRTRNYFISQVASHPPS